MVDDNVNSTRASSGLRHYEMDWPFSAKVKRGGPSPLDNLMADVHVDHLYDVLDFRRRAWRLMHSLRAGAILVEGYDCP
jgi:hypothetical protein